MKFECPNCKKSGQVDDSKVPESGVYAVCPQCSNKFLVKRESSNDFDFDFEPVEPSILKVTNITSPPHETPRQSPPSQQDTTSRDNSSTTPPEQEPKQQTNDSDTRKQLYKAAIGKNIDYYLPIFERFDREGKTSVSWNWSAFFCGGLWCLHRKMNLIGYLYIIASIVLGVFEKVDTQGVLAIPLFLIYSALLFGFGMYANTFYYNHLNKKISGLHLTMQNTSNLESFSKLFKPNKAVYYVFGVFIGLSVIGIIAAIAIPQLNRKEAAPNATPREEWIPASAPAVETPTHDNLKPFTGKVDPVSPSLKPEDEAAKDRHIARILAKHPDAFTLLPAVEKWIAAQPAKEKARNTYVLESGTAHEVIKLFNIYKQATRGATAPLSSGMIVYPEKNENVSKNTQSNRSRINYEYTKIPDSSIDKSPSNISSTKIASPTKVIKFDDLSPGQKASVELSCFEEKVKGRFFFEECINKRLLAK